MTENKRLCGEIEIQFDNVNATREEIKYFKDTLRELSKTYLGNENNGIWISRLIQCDTLEKMIQND